MGNIILTGERNWLRGLFGDEWAWLVGEAETGDRYSLLERIAHRGAQSTPHRHRRIEAFYVLEGEFELTVGDRTVRGGPGTVAVAQEQEIHGWRLLGENDGRMLLFFAPTTPRDFYRDLDGALSGSERGPDMHEVLEITRRHGI